MYIFRKEKKDDWQKKLKEKAVQSRNRRKGMWGEAAGDYSHPSYKKNYPWK